MIKIYTTMNSVYEVDEENRKYRRTYGRHSPKRAMIDGQWKDYESCHKYLNGLLFYFEGEEPLLTSQIRCVT